MAIQGTQVPMYTKHTLLLYFSDFLIIYLFILYEKQNKQHQKKKKKNVKQNNKTRLTQKKNKNTQVMQDKNKKREKK